MRILISTIGYGENKDRTRLTVDDAGNVILVVEPNLSAAAQEAVRARTAHAIARVVG